MEGRHPPPWLPAYSCLVRIWCARTTPAVCALQPGADIVSERVRTNPFEHEATQGCVMNVAAGEEVAGCRAAARRTFACRATTSGCREG